MDYIKFCEDMCIPKKLVTKYPNDKPWFDRSVSNQISAKEAAVKSDDRSAIEKAKYDDLKAIQQAKRRYRDI